MRATLGTLGTIGKMPGVSKRVGGASTLGKESPFRGFFPFQASPDGQFNTSGGGGKNRLGGDIILCPARVR